MTPGKWLHYHHDGARHVHSDEEALWPLSLWRLGAECPECAHKGPKRDSESTQAVNPRKAKP